MKAFFLSMLASLFFLGNVWGGVQYSVTDLGTLGNTSIGLHINASGQVVGSSYTSAGEEHGFLYSGGMMQDMGTFGGYLSSANCINSKGQIAGVYEEKHLPPGGSCVHHYQHAIIYYNGNKTEFGTLVGESSCALGINDSGQVVGYAFNPQDTHAFLYSAGTMTNLGTLGGPTSSANSINSSGQIVGNSTTTFGGRDHAFLYSGGTMHDLGTLAGGNTYANCINNSGQVVGSSDVGGYYHAFLYSDGSMQDLGTFGGAQSYGYSINTSGQIVGYFSRRTTNASVAYIYDRGVVQELNTLIDPSLHWNLFLATSINDSGWIVGQGSNPNGKTHAFLLKPVPEPSVISLLGVVVLSFLIYAWKTRH